MKALFSERLIMTPGPTEVPYRVMMAMTKQETNSDLDPDFLSFYQDLRSRAAKLFGATRSRVYLMIGEAMLGLESAIANTVSRGDKVIVVDNGVYGDAFADLVRSYGGVPVKLGANWRRAVDLGDLERALERNRDAAAVTVVHCDTPSAMLNDLAGVARVAKSFGTLVIADVVSTIGAMPLQVDSWGVDIAIGGSQKALNAPAGVTLMSVSEEAMERARRVNYQGFYMSLLQWESWLDSRGVFPYTVSEPLLYAASEAINMVLEEGLDRVYSRHLAARRAAWASFEALGLKHYPDIMEHSSPTVTAAEVPGGVDEAKLRDLAWRKYNTMIASSWGPLQGKVIRVGHMGVQASPERLARAFLALGSAMRDLGLSVSPEEAARAALESFRY
ncbi:pyridoxal-phosphate-dependent aminotransferase family protein [Acidilobus sp.]|uniref:pyridoxal-phosphate-dependent aminotransferase family protein n=1 Tax=Acidilobus sp. TaxID=1872109 RepID=UPI003CFCC1E6